MLMCWKLTWLGPLFSDSLSPLRPLMPPGPPGLPPGPPPPEAGPPRPSVLDRCWTIDIIKSLARLIASRDPVSVQVRSDMPPESGAIWILQPDSFWRRLICSPPRPITINQKKKHKLIFNLEWKNLNYLGNKIIKKGLFIYLKIS